MEHDDCTKCRMENGTTAKIRMRYVEGQFYGEIMSCDSYFYKDILKEVGMKYHYGYDWCFVFKDRFYKAELDSKIELLRKKKIIITEVGEDGVLDEELRFLKQNARNKCVERVISEAPEYLQPYLRGEVEDSGLFVTVYYQIALDRQKRWKEKKDKIAAIERPIVPNVLKGHKWNQKIYGKSGNYSIYPDGEKTVITDEQAGEIKNYLVAKEEYRKKVEEVEKCVEVLKD